MENYIYEGREIDSIPVFMWGDSSNDEWLSPWFAWLINIRGKDEDARATIYQNHKEYGDDLFHWTAHLSPPDEDGFIPDSDKDKHGAAFTMEEAKRACEEALGLLMCGHHPARKPKLRC